MTSLRLFAAMLLAVFLVMPCVARGGDLDLVRQRFRDYALSEQSGRGDRLLDDVELPKSKVADAMKLAGSLGANGSWPDVNYHSNARSSWSPGDHLTRLLSMTVYAEWKSTSAVNRQRMLDAIHRGLAFWMPHDFQCPNWWYNEIGGPKLLGTIGLLLGSDLKPEEKRYITETVLTRSHVGAMTGQNRVWLAANGLMRGLLLNDSALVAKAADVIWDELRVADRPGVEGIQADWSFHQHGPQLQFGNYGQAFAVEMSRWATVLRGSAFAMPAKKLAILRNYLLNGENWVVWNGEMDISSCGRQLFPHSPQSKASAIGAVMETMATADPAHAPQYHDFVARNGSNPPAGNDLVGSRYFWRSDYMVYRRPRWAATLRMNSSRTIGGELVNSENLSGSLLGDGATYFYRSGHEYNDIFPLWDWRMIPGITAQLSDDPTRWPKAGVPHGQAFVGGVETGGGGAAAMELSRGSLSAKKCWFFFDDTVVCLGSEIRSPSTAITTINQCLLNGAVTACAAGGTSQLPAGAPAPADTQWIEHDGLRYTLLQPASLVLETGSRSGNWHKVFDTPGAPKGDVTGSVFTLYLQHRNQQDGSYAYAVGPAGQENGARVLSNDGSLAAAGGGDWTGIVFWKAGTTSVGGLSIAVSDPCIVVGRRSGGRWHWSIADPTQLLQKVSISVDGKAISCDLPQGVNAGATVAVPE